MKSPSQILQYIEYAFTTLMLVSYLIDDMPWLAMNAVFLLYTQRNRFSL